VEEALISKLVGGGRVNKKLKRWRCKRRVKGSYQTSVSARSWIWTATGSYR